MWGKVLSECHDLTRIGRGSFPKSPRDYSRQFFGRYQDSVLVTVDPVTGLELHAAKLDDVIYLTHARLAALGRIDSQRLAAKINFREFPGISNCAENYAAGPSILCAFGSDNVPHQGGFG